MLGGCPNNRGWVFPICWPNSGGCPRSFVVEGYEAEGKDFSKFLVERGEDFSSLRRVNHNTSKGKKSFEHYERESDLQWW